MKTKYTKKQITEAIAHWKKVLESMGPLEEVGADDILNMWKSKQDAEAKNSPAADSKSATPAQEVKPKKFTSYAMGNNTHELYAGDWIFGMYMQKDQKYAYYAIYRMSKLNAPKFKSLKNKSQTSTLKMFLTREAELIEKDEHGDWTLDKFIDEMKRLVGPSHFNRQPVLFTAGLKKTIYHYDRNPAHRGKTTMTTQTTGHITYDLNDIKFDAADIDVHSGRSKQHQLAYGGSSSKLPRQQKDHSYEEIQEAIAHWTKVLEDLDNGQRDVSISLDFVTEKPYIKGKYQGEYTPDEFQQLCRSWERKYGINISMAIPGESSASATGIISGPESAVRKFVDEVYDARTVHDPRMSDEEWKDILGETLENDPDTESIIENARENVASINEMIAEIEKNGSTPLNAEILGSIVEFNDWCQEQMDKNGIS